MKSIRTLPAIAIVALTAAAFAGGFAFAQKQDQNEAIVYKFMNEFIIHEAKTKVRNAQLVNKDKPTESISDSEAALIADYEKAARNPVLTNSLLRYTASSHAAEAFQASTAPQLSNANETATVRLLMLQCAQNQRIIELLSTKR